MSGKWKKAVWGICMVQFLFWHAALLYRFSFFLNTLSWKVSVRLNLPLWFYDKGTAAVISGLLAVSGLLFLWDGCGYVRLRRRYLGKMEPVNGERIRRLFLRACEDSGLQGDPAYFRVTLAVCPGLSTPMVLGFAEPVLLLPPALLDPGFPEEQLSMLLLHECMHLKQKDTGYKLFLLVLNRLTWFNPLSWLVKQLGFRDTEVACDEAVVKNRSREERLAYGQLLLDALRWGAANSSAGLTLFVSSRSVLRSRIRAIMEPQKRWDRAARAAVACLAMETCLFGGTVIARSVRLLEQERKPENLYEGYELPSHFSRETVDKMLTLKPAGENTFYEEWQLQKGSRVDSFDQLSVEAAGPWQVRILNTNDYRECALLLAERYLCWFEKQEWESRRDPESGIGSVLETVYSRLLAGDREEAVFALIVKQYMSPEELQSLPVTQAVAEGWGEQVRENGTDYIYYSLAVHIRHREEHVFEMTGITGLEEAMEALRERWPQNDFSYIPVLKLKRSLNGCQTMRVSLSDGTLRLLRREDADWETVCTEPEWLLERGDQMEGALTSLQEGSWQADEKKQIFAGGGSWDYEAGRPIPVRVIYYEEVSGSWRESVVTDRYTAVRRIFVSFPENSSRGWVILTDERTMWQERTAAFYTEDGGETWETVEPSCFEGLPEYYTQCWMPEWEQGELVMYVGMEDYSKYGGMKARCVSGDGGKTWNFTGYALRQ